MASIISRNIWKLLFSLPVIGWRLKLFKSYRQIPFPPGHYYSTTPDVTEIAQHQEEIFENEDIKGIDLQLEEQQNLLYQLLPFYNEVPYNFSEKGDIKNHKLRYKVKNAFYRYSDSIFLFCMMRYFKPNKMVEVGSGHSSAIMLDTNELFFNDRIQITFIEPFPEERLEKVFRLTDHDHSVLLKNKVQETNPQIFEDLNKNDFLFIDSSHVSKAGSDVNYIFFHILPLLKPGVFIHFHDIFYPFELPRTWVLKDHWFWNENYILRAFLMNNPDYEIILFNDFLHKKNRMWFEKEMPDCLTDMGNTGSIWIRKIR
ncbi:MAG: class I SAM-dependent methyltransferase [Bacteroidia bacterium]